MGSRSVHRLKRINVKRHFLHQMLFLVLALARAQTELIGKTFFSTHTVDADAVLCANCTFINAGGASHGGALSISNGALSVSFCVFIQCRAQYGGAIYVSTASTIVQDSTFDRCFVVLGDWGAWGNCLSASDGETTISNIKITPFRGSDPFRPEFTCADGLITFYNVSYDGNGHGNVFLSTSGPQFLAEGLTLKNINAGADLSAITLESIESTLRFCSFENIVGTKGAVLTLRLDAKMLSLTNVSFVYITGSSIHFLSDVELIATHCCFSKAIGEELSGLTEGIENVFGPGTFEEGACSRGRKLSASELWGPAHTISLILVVIVLVLFTLAFCIGHIACGSRGKWKCKCCDNEVDAALRKRWKVPSSDESSEYESESEDVL